MRKIGSMLLLVALLAILLPVNAQAAGRGARWTREKGDTWILQDGQGTDLKANLDGNTLYVYGKGAIPDYSLAELGNRPWHGLSVYQLVVGREVTGIGEHAFAALPDLERVSLYSTTFIENGNAFAQVKSDCVFDVIGMEMSRRDIGKIPFTSMDQFVLEMSRYEFDYRFSFSNPYMVRYVNHGRGARWYNAANSDPYSASENINYPIVNYDSKITCNTPDGSYATSYDIQYRRQGKAALEAFAAFMGDNQFGCTYSMHAYKGRTENTKLSANPMQYTITIPNALIYPGRQFSLLQIGKGVVNVLPDLDADEHTMTFQTDYLSTGYALVYKDTIVTP